MSITKSNFNITPASLDSYQEALSYLYNQLPMFSRTGAAAYKPGLDTSYRLDDFFGHPHRKFKSIHIGGTNGKGSTSSMLAAILQAQGYKTALYTSPHLVDFRERIRINGEMIPKKEVVDFVKRWQQSGYDGHPSFFELTMMMAFDWFAKEEVDYAIIEVGMGGRLDSTNIITPLLGIITNISFDHTQFLGDTIPKIALEKAGIIKPGIPAIIGETTDETRNIFNQKAKETNSEITFAEDDKDAVISIKQPAEYYGWECITREGNFLLPLGGEYQKKNLQTVLATIKALRKSGIDISASNVAKGIENVSCFTGLQGRWSILSNSPLAIADTGHNIAGISYNMEQLNRIIASSGTAKLHMVIGFVADKDIEHIIELLPKHAKYYLTNAQIPRALPADKLYEIFIQKGFTAEKFPDVSLAYKAATTSSSPEDVIYVGGSTFIVADLLAYLQ